MKTAAKHYAEQSAPTFAELFMPKLVTVLSEGYGLNQFRADAIAGLTVAIVALPLSMAIAIASGASPAQGLYTAIIGGFLVSVLGGSRFPSRHEAIFVGNLADGPPRILRSRPQAAKRPLRKFDCFGSR